MWHNADQQWKFMFGHARFYSADISLIKRFKRTKQFRFIKLDKNQSKWSNGCYFLINYERVYHTQNSS